MAFLLADSFQFSLDKLNGEDQKAAKLAAFELQINPANPGLHCHRLDNIKDKNFWSARDNRDIRLIFHRVESSVMLCYVAYHDSADECQDITAAQLRLLAALAGTSTDALFFAGDLGQRIFQRPLS
jgi:mRNA-degrading endonuclease RelE of RelBE toxin-antitoxin system